ncbi:MAG: hypothetical protein MUF42_11365 [Cytophagaceae bacterium]|jgi:hypothetical protein|nr:hypothetical protein [Cytophagaceae bacterium]
MLTTEILKEAISLAQQKSKEELSAHFEDKGVSKETIQLLLDEIKKFEYLKRRKKGIQLLASGCLLLLMGFILTVVLFHRGGAFDAIMYSFSVVGIGLLFWGMIEFLGW